MSSFAFEGVAKSFPAPRGGKIEALRDFSLECGEGEFLVLLGPSGSGKTTVLRLVAGIEPPDSGRMTLNGQPAERLPARDRDVAMVFQHPALYPHLTVAENIRLGLKIRRLGGPEIADRTRWAADLLEIGPLLDRSPAGLSGGQMQRVALARAVARRPGLLLLDEPLANLDGPARGSLKDRVRELQAATKITTVLVTHDQAEAFSLASKIAVLGAGRVLQAGNPADLYRRPVTLEMAQFLARPRLNVFDGHLCEPGEERWFETDGIAGRPGVRIRLPDGATRLAEVPGGQRTLLGLRPEGMILRPVKTDDVPGRGTPAFLRRVETLGGWTDLHLDLGGISLVARCLHGEFVVGESFEVGVDSGAAMFFDPASGRRLG
jgi:ABC-type sugar transport system ATPase subunit